jgi:cytoskeletal protein CcmA (bactofilin family)
MSGELDTEGSLLIKGKFSGALRSASHVSVDKVAWVESCSLSAPSLTVAGRFSGSIKAKGPVEFQDRAMIHASVECGSLRVSPACRFEGRVSMPDLDLHDLRLNKGGVLPDDSAGDD